jgi:hypothetical protein
VATGTDNVQGVRQVPLSETVACAPCGLESIVKIAGSPVNRSTLGNGSEQFASTRPHARIAHILLMFVP